MIYHFIASLWFLSQIKATLFWIYLWQLKEYHIGRFLAHFETQAGKKLLFNKILTFKILILFSFLIGLILFGQKSSILFYLSKYLLLIPFFAVLILYFFSAFYFLFSTLKGKLKKPHFTIKTIFLTIIALFFQALFLFFNFRESLLFLILILLFDILTPIIISGILLFFQPFTVLIRNQIIKKAKRKRAEFKDLLVIGITGSYGKTSTKEFLAQVLKERFKVLKTKEHQNSEIAISRTILNDLKPEHQIFIVEMGAYNRGGIKLLCDIAKPKIGILTGINEQHLSTFGSLENIIKTKFELIESLPEDGIAFFNGKNKYCRELYKKTPKQRKFAAGQAKIKKILYGQKVKIRGFENIEGVKAVAKELGMTEEEISRALKKIKNKFPGIEEKKGILGFKILDATYSANPDGVIAHLEYLKTLSGKKVIVLPCLIELGDAAKKVHQKIGQKIGKVCDLAIICTKDYFKEIKEKAVKNGMQPENILFLENSEEIFAKIKSFCQKGDLILLESRVPKKLIELLTQKSPNFDGRQKHGINKNGPIFTSLSPNTEKDDILLALRLIFQPKKWKKGKEPQRLEEEFKKYLRVKYAFSFNSGRAAFLAILDALGIKEGDEILLQAFTCNSAITPILERKAKPVFVDIDETLNLDPKDLQKKITLKSKAVMVQHNFGFPAKIEEISKISKEHNLFLIEDAAHSLGAKYSPPHQSFGVGVKKYCGTLGDVAFFSFGRDKIISSVFGGMAVTNGDNLAKKIKKIQEKLNCPSNFWIFQQLLHPILTNSLIIPIYGLSNTLGRMILGAFHKLSILSKSVPKEEKRGKLSKNFPKRLPSALAILALNQFKKLERFNEHRREIAKFYQKELKETNFILPFKGSKKNIVPTFMRFPILVKEIDTDEILKKAKKEKIFLNDGWRKSPVVPPDTNLDKMKYKLGSCPKAEKVAQNIINLPTHINISKFKAQKIVNFLKNYGS